MKKINEEWHKANRMPKNPTMEQRITWHLEHQKNCNCRDIPNTIKQAIQDKKK